MNKRIIVFGNGKLTKKFIDYIKPGDYIIGVDRAAYWLLRNGVVPHIAIGDFDSTTKGELRLIKKDIRIVKQYSPQKNWTDMELAITYAAKKHPSEVLIFGGTGTRHDHSLATLHSLDLLLKGHIPHAVLDTNNRIRLIGHGKTVVKKPSYRYISLLPYTKIIRLSLTGFRYNLVGKILKQGTTLGISNEIRGTRAVIDIFSGKAWVIESND